MKRTVATLLPALLLLGLVLLTGCGGVGSAGGSGGTAPTFSGMTTNGQQVSLESYKGKPLALVFWASW